MTSREETQQQIARCAVLEQRLERDRYALRQECSRQRSALRRTRTRIEMAEHWAPEAHAPAGRRRRGHH
jgi:hypothetical protein